MAGAASGECFGKKRIDMEILNYIRETAPDIVTGFLTAVATAYGMFKVFTSKWLDAKFAERLEAFKTQQNIQFDRLLKLHQREFDVLSEARVLLLETYSRAHELWWGLTTSQNPNGFNDLQAAFGASHNYLFKNSIFLKADIEELFFKIDELMHLAICEERTNRQCATSSGFVPSIVAQTALFSQGKGLLDDLKNRIKERIWTRDAS